MRRASNEVEVVTVANSNTATPVESEGSAADRVLTVPNALSALRLLGVPLFVYLLLGPHADGWAIALLMVSGATDWLDGKLARLLNQASRLGAFLDPAADRLYVLATLVAFGVRNVVPWWVVAVLVGRDVLLALALQSVRSRGVSVLPVHYLGKAATFCLLYAFPLLLIGEATSTFATVARPWAYALTVWGGGMYVWAGVLYLVQVRAVHRQLPVLAP